MQWRALNLAKAPYTAYKASTYIGYDIQCSSYKQTAYCMLYDAMSKPITCMLKVCCDVEA